MTLTNYEKAKYGTSSIVGVVAGKVSYDLIRDHQKNDIDVIYVKDLDDVDDFDDDEDDE
jgi:hypothetical protein